MSVDLLLKRDNLIKQLNTKLTEHAQHGYTAAVADRDYKIAKAKMMVKIRADGVPWTATDALARGDEEVANLAFERDSNNVLSQSALEASYVLRLVLKANEEDIKFDQRRDNGGNA